MRIPENFLDRIEFAAKQRGISRHQIIREAIGEWLDQHWSEGDEVALKEDLDRRTKSVE